MKCPKCKSEFTPTPRQIASEMGKRKSPAKAAAAKLNGAKGGLTSEQATKAAKLRWQRVREATARAAKAGRKQPSP